MKVPDFIGYPGKQTSGAYGGDFDKDYDNFVDDKIVIATLKPGLPIIQGDANVYKLDPAWGDYVADLSNLGIDPPNKQQIDVVISRLSPITRNYQNNYGDSNILPKGNILGESAQEIMQLIGGDTEKLQKILQEKNGGKVRQALGWSVDKWNKLVNGFQNGGNQLADSLGDAAPIAKTVVNATSALAKAPQSKIGWPKMWRDCSFGQSYQLNTRLYCYSTDNADDFNNNIRAAMAALELFVTPKSKDGMLYTAPYMLEFDIPGMLHFPQAYIEDMNVIEGGDEGDFAQTGRPNVIDIQMTIQSNYSISVNTPPGPDMKYPGRPSVRKDLIGLASGKNIGKTSSYMSGSGSSVAGKSKSYDEAKEEQDIANAISDIYSGKAVKTRADRTLTAQQQAAATALADPTSNMNKTPAEIITPESENS